MRRLALALLLLATPVSAEEPRPRLRDAGFIVGPLATGPLNAITDVPGVTVGQVTLIKGDTVRTGVTVIRPHGGNLFQDKVPAAFFRANGFGKFAGSPQIDELGEIESPIILTNTLNVAEGLAGGIAWTLAQPGNEQVRSVNVVVGETNDGYLNDIRGRHVTAADVQAAIAARETRPGGRRQRRRRHGDAGVRVEGRHRHIVARRRDRPGALHRRCSRPDQFRRAV